MKQFIKNKKVTYNLMSFTGYKALLVFSLLTESPKSYEEVCEYFVNHPYLRGEKISIDTFRVYMNSLKRFGCEIKRTKGEDKISRYQIIKHPFELTLDNDQIESIIKVFKNITKCLNIYEIYELQNFIEKIANYVGNEEFLEKINKASILKDIDKNIINTLIDCCKQKNQIVIDYKSPNSGYKDIELIADKLDITNGKAYLYGTGFEYNQYASFLLSRIRGIKDIKTETTYPKQLKEIKVKYELSFKPVLQKGEKLLETRNNKFVIESTTSNEFLLQQKLLEYGPACKILEPESFKNDFVALLKDMKAGYYCG